MSDSSYILAYKRTPIGSFMGSLSSVSAPQLAASSIDCMLNDLGVDPHHYEQIIMGNVLQAGVGQAPARQAALKAGLPDSVCATTINKVCGSGLQSVAYADQLIRLGASSLIIAGGMENMSQAPHFLQSMREGAKLGAQNLQDSLIHDGLWDPYNNIHMGTCAERLATDKGYTREQQDNYALESYRRALDAIDNGLMEKEISPVTISTKKGEIVVSKDEEPAKFIPGKIAKLRPPFAQDGTITAANASSISDGAAAIVLSSLEAAKKLNIKPAARIVAHCSFAHKPINFTTAPIQAIGKVLDSCRIDINDIDLFEINEAFACVVMAAIEELNIDNEKVNIHGGAISLGHPIGASGTRVLVTLLSALKTYNKKFGLATLCIGGGEAIAIVVENLADGIE